MSINIECSLLQKKTDAIVLNGTMPSNLMRLKLQYPEIYEQFVTVSEFRTFHVKVSSVDAA